MAIKVPTAMVYYSERDAQSERLLCWIPPQQYPDVSDDDEALQRLRKSYPRGVEVRVHRKELEAEGIRFSIAPEDLTKTYKRLKDRGALHESGMIFAATLELNAKAIKSGESLDSLIDTDRQRLSTFPTAATETPPKQAHHIAEPPEMIGGEEPSDVFQRFSVRQHAKSNKNG